MHGIGAGILINGQLFQGDGGGAGEIGHVVVQENGLPCRCGRNGCLETVASAQAVVARMQSLTNSPDPISLDVLESKFQDGDQTARQVITDAATYLGRSIGNLVGTFNIKTIVLTGDMTRFGEPWLMAVRQAMSQAALGRMVEGTQLHIGKLDYRACILGSAAHLLLDGYSLLFTQSGN